MGSYVHSTLMPNENVTYEAKLHWFIFVPHVILMAILIGFITIISPVIAWFTTEMVLTNRRIIMKKGLISRYTFEMSFAKVETIQIDQGIIGRLFGYGSVTVVGTGGSKACFAYIADPLEFRKQFLRLTDPALTPGHAA